MLQVGQSVPEFSFECVLSPKGDSFWVSGPKEQSRWQLILFYPRDFSFVCPTEVISFSENFQEFDNRNCDILAVSIDSINVHRRWLDASEAQGGVGQLNFPLASDPDGQTARNWGLWDEVAQLPLRGLMLIDPQGVLQYHVVHNLDVGRSVEETVRVLQALQTGGLCPASWTNEEGNLDPEQLLNEGRVLGHYEIRKTLGTGTFGTVFAAWDLRLEREVAIKVLRRTHGEARNSLLAEARSVSSLSHPYICTIYSVEQLDHLPVIVMQHVDGESLASRISNEDLSPDIARHMTRRIAEGLAVAHENGIVHGDLKPANILIDSEDRPVIVDFGMTASHKVKLSSLQPSLSRNLDTNVAALEATLDWVQTPEEPTPNSGAAVDTGETAEMAQTVSWYGSTARLVGTPAYMSPEQAHGALPSSVSDVFSLGLIYAEMISGDRVLCEPNLASILHALRSDNVAHRVLQLLGDRFPKACLAMLQPEPADRPTARQVVAALGETG